MCPKRNIEARWHNHNCRGKAINITYSENVLVALVIQYAMRMRHIILSSVFWIYHIFPHYLINCAIFGRSLLNVKCVF
jgi:hypothetical protein